MSRVAITGAAGFVGSHLVAALAQDGHEVRGLVRPGGRQGGSRQAHYVSGDIRNEESVRTLVSDCDSVIHLAASFSPSDDVADITVQGTRNVLTAAQEAGVRRLLMVSCLGAEAASHAPYLVGKWKAEQLVRGAELQYVILRPSLILGQGDGFSRPLAAVIRTLPVIPIPGKGETRTQPIDVGDVVQCVIAGLHNDDLLDQVISVGGPMFITYRQLTDLFSGQLNVFKPKLLVPERWLPAFQRWLPAGSRGLYAPARLAVVRQGVVASPGIVQRMFGFEPRSIVPLLSSYTG